MNRLTDFHSHILPGVDDGSGSVEESLQMLRMEAQQGITCVVATPHFYPRHDRPDRFLARRAEAFAVLQEAMARETALPRVELGAEVHFFSGMSDSDVLQQLTIAGKRCILVEMPLSPWTAAMYRELEGIYQKQDLIPVIAHIDRYIRPLQTHGIFQHLAELPVLVQANAEFFANRRTASLALRLLRQGRIHVLGSDCHNVTDRRPNLAEARIVISHHGGSGIFDRIRENEAKILSVL